MYGQYQSSVTSARDGDSAQARIDSSRRQIIAGESGATPVPVTAASSAPLPVVTQPVEVLVAPTVSSAAYSSGVSIGGAIPLSGGFIVGASAGSLRDLSVGLGVSTTANMTATILRGAVSTASTVGDHSTASIVAADITKVVGVEVLTPLYPPGASSAVGTVYRATGLDYVVGSGGFVVLTPSATVTLPSTSAVTVAAGIA